jgi:two-component system, sensor histidine kinase and response regulator
MLTNERSRSFLESRYGKPGLKIPELVEAPGIFEFVRRDAFDELQRAHESLRAQAAVLQARNRDLEAYAHMVAHDLKDPLTALVVTADLLTDIPDITRLELKEYLHQIKSTAYDMNGTIKSLLLFTEVTRADAPVGPVDMAAVVANVLDRLSYLIKENRARIDLPQVWPAAIGYAPWLEEVWANYLSNAIKHGGQPPRVELGASTRPGGVQQFWIRDNGPGIPPKTRARLFTPFSHNSHTRNPGNGLGLSIVRSIVEKLGGMVGVESELGHGSLFFFTLPAGNPART